MRYSPLMPRRYQVRWWERVSVPAAVPAVVFGLAYLSLVLWIINKFLYMVQHG